MIRIRKFDNREAIGFSSQSVNEKRHQELESVAKYIYVTISENSDYIGWSSRDFLSFENIELGQIDEDFPYLFGSKVLGIGVSKTSGLFSILINKKGKDSMNNHIDINSPLLKSIEVYDFNSDLSEIDRGNGAALITIDFSNVTKESLGYSESQDEICFSSNEITGDVSPNFSSGNSYIVKVNLNQQILDRFETLNSYPMKVNESAIVSDRLFTTPSSAYIFRNSRNYPVIKVKHNWQLLKLGQFDRFILNIGQDTIDTSTSPGSIVVGEDGFLELRINELVSAVGEFNTELIGFSDKYIDGVVIWHPNLTYANVTIKCVTT